MDFPQNYCQANANNFSLETNNIYYLPQPDTLIYIIIKTEENIAMEEITCKSNTGRVFTIFCGT